MVETRKMAVNITGLTPIEIDALRAFTTCLQEAFLRQVKEIALFGSKARGDSQVDSDMDVLVIVGQEDRTLRRKIIDVASAVSLEYDVLISPRVISQKRWQERQNFSLYQNIARDALPLLSEGN